MSNTVSKKGETVMYLGRASPLESYGCYLNNSECYNKNVMGKFGYYKNVMYLCSVIT